MNSAYKILLVDDDVDILEFIQYNLVNEGFNVKTCSNGIDAIDLTKDYIPDLILLDVMMPKMDGIETCGILRQDPKLNDTIIAFLTARGEDYSQIAGFDAGADDYITKPIKPKLLVSRVKALLKRLSSHSEKLENNDVIELDNLKIDRSSYILFIDGSEIKLPKKEFELLFLLVSKTGKIVSRSQIYQKIWGSDVIVGDRTIDVYIRKLRGVIGNDKIQTVKGVGYKFMG